MSGGSSRVRARLRSSGYAPALAVVGFLLLAVVPWHPICPIWEGGPRLTLACRLAPPLQAPTSLELVSVLLFVVVLTLLPLTLTNPLAMIVLGLTASAVIITLNFSFEAYFAAVKGGFVEFDQEARYGLLLLFPSCAALSWRDYSVWSRQ
jgi:hypothetical protein